MGLGGGGEGGGDEGEGGGGKGAAEDAGKQWGWHAGPMHVGVQADPNQQQPEPASFHSVSDSHG